MDVTTILVGILVIIALVAYVVWPRDGARDVAARKGRAGSGRRGVIE